MVTYWMNVINSKLGEKQILLVFQVQDSYHTVQQKYQNEKYFYFFINTWEIFDITCSKGVSTDTFFFKKNQH